MPINGGGLSRGDAREVGAGLAPPIGINAIADTLGYGLRRMDVGGSMSGFPSSAKIDLGAWSRPPAAGAPDRLSPAAEQTDYHGVGLAKMVESEIIPRLMLAHRALSAPPLRPAESSESLDEEAVETFARMVVSREPDSLIAYVGTLLQTGVSMETIHVGLLAPAARRLGDYWNDDSVSFTDVTIGLGRLQQLVRALGWKIPGGLDDDRLTRSAFFAPGPGEQHTFGLFILEDYFRRSGWRTWVETSATDDELVDTVRGHWFDVFGMSVSADTHLDHVRANIGAVRKASRNPELFVMVGGRLFVEHPELVLDVSADATAVSGGEALLIANLALLVDGNEVSALASPE